MPDIAFYYLHQNGDLIYKKFRPDDSPFVKKIWSVDLEDRLDVWFLCTEALALGARRDRVLALAKNWGLTDEDAHEFARRVKIKLALDGDQWCATFEDFVNLQESQAGFGPTCLEAMAGLAQGGLCPDRES